MEKIKKVKIWVDDVREKPEGYDLWAMTVPDAIFYLGLCYPDIEVLDLDHDAGNCAKFGGDYIEILNFMEEANLDIPIRIHSMNPVGRANMERIIRKNGWKLIP